jgi:pSer/pThr/pTyr-binding forkhead associated (FHA) protein
MRPSETTRERAVSRLRGGYVSGRLNTETFSERVEQALRAERDDELRGLTADVEAPRRTQLDRLRDLLPRPAARSARLPPADRLSGASLLLGRSSACQIVFADDTVSRRHAELRLRDGAWFIRDLGSSNGTWVNGRRVVEAEVAPGDELCLGDCRFRL